MDPEWALEQYEMSEAYLDYLGAVQLYNKFHAKFRRRLPDWLQVLFPVFCFSCPLFLCSLCSVLTVFSRPGSLTGCCGAWGWRPW